MFFAFAILGVATANIIDVPKKVADAFKAKYPTVQDATWEEEEDEEFYMYTATFLLDGKEMESLFDEDGDWITSVTTLTEEDLLPEITVYLEKNYDEFSIFSAAKIENEDGATYSLSIETVVDEEADETNSYLLTFDSKGQLIEE